MKCIKNLLLLLTTALLIFTQNGSALEGSTNSQTSTAITLVAEDNSVQPGRPFWVAVHLTLAPDWHAYWKNPGDAGMPVQVDWDLPPNFTVGELEWPYPQKMELSGIIGFGYDNELTLLAQITPDAASPSLQSIEIGAKTRWLSCSNAECVPGSQRLSLNLPVSSEPPTPNPQYAALFAKARENMPELPEAVLVSRENDTLHLKVKMDHLADAKDKSNLKFEFYPEAKKLVDLRHSEGSLSSDGTAALALKELRKSTSLKGVLVAKNGNTTRAFHVDAEIDKASLNNDEIALAEIPLKHNSIQTSSHGNDSDATGFWMALFLAFIGGVILNLMPCVLPVISFKVLSFVKMARETRATTFKHGLSFSFGVVASFWVLAGLLLTLRAYGNTVGWGFQLQEPLFVGILAGVMFLLSLSLLGVFELGMSVSSWAGQMEHSTKTEAPEGLFTSFCSGILATALATPCTGPFLGSAIGLAVTLPSYQALLIFTSLGLGMAFPYLLLGSFPSLLRFMPKPGAWMETFKQLMGFMVLASVLWLVWVFAAQTNEFSLFFLLIALYFLAIGSWVYGRWATPSRSRKSRVAGTITALALLIASVQVIHIASTSLSPSIEQKSDIAEAWEPYSAARIAELQKQGTPVIVDFTAKWCLICQANHMVLSTDDVSSKLNDLGVVRMKADWTRNDPEITEALTQFGRNSVPLYLLYGSSSSESPVILPQVLTPDIVMEELERLSGPIAENEEA